MWFLWAVTWLSTLVQLAFAVISLAAGLYYLSELVEEYTTYAAVLLNWLILCSCALCVCFCVFAGFDTLLCVVGVACQIAHFAIMQNFPVFAMMSASFIAASVLNVLHHWLAFRFFAEHYFEFTEVIAYFTLCAWIVPCALLVSLSADEQVLPMHALQHTMKYTDEDTPLIATAGNDYVSHYMRGKSHTKRHTLRALISSVKDSLIPTRSNKRYT